MGRLEHALDSLRLLCTTDSLRAQKLADTLGETNRLRQDLTQKSTDHALALFNPLKLPKILIAADTAYDEGIIGLIASKLVDRYFRPAVVVSIGPQKSKASARSIPGFHITEYLRKFEPLFESVGGHAMAAGFTIATSKLPQVQKKLIKQAQIDIKPEILVRNQHIDAEITPQVLDLDLYLRLQDFAPFGLGNPRPVFRSYQVPISYPKRVGKDNKHLKFTSGNLEAIYFSAPPGVESGITRFDITYSLNVNMFNGQEILQMIVKQLTPSIESREGDRG
jgi:single-stranded-DNA-specific exonuclease